MVDYYKQRASAGLIITEATGISPQGLGFPYAAGLWNAEQIEAWKLVTSAVHDAGGRIMVQLWHMGRVSHSSFPGRGQPVSASATTAPGFAHTYMGKRPYEEARSLELEEIPRIVADYRQAALNAIAAGFDGVQVHGANGFLIDQFLRSNSNFRRDRYGGSFENRIRLLSEITVAVADAVGACRTSVRLSPNGEVKGVNDDDPEPLFIEAAKMLSRIGIAFLEVREPGLDGTNGKGDRPPISPLIGKLFAGPIVLNADYDQAKGQATLDASLADAISFGRHFIANPDLPERFRRGLPLATSDSGTWYTSGSEGYSDYPTL
jgi:2,4-dienoyl-CoA reductase-like NADH-dependent reductase (Old Yellow Enzyme family)